MREQLISYVELLFAGTTGFGDMKQEILQNTLERYDDLISQGKVPEAAYRLAISGIGDVNELLGDSTVATRSSGQTPVKTDVPSFTKRLLKAIAIFLYIISPVPLFVLETINMEEIGLCGTLAICGLATALLVIGRTTAFRKKQSDSNDPPRTKEINPLCKAICTLITTIGIITYLFVSFWSGAWYITWVIFPLIGSVKGLLRAILGLTEEEK